MKTSRLLAALLLVGLVGLSVPGAARAEDESRALYESITNNYPAGSYFVTINGKRFVNESVLDITLTTKDGKPVPAGTSLTVETLPGASTKSGQAARTYELQPTSGNNYRLTPDFDAAGRWNMKLNIAGPAGTGQTDIAIRVYPRRPEAPFWFGWTQILLPVVLVGGLLAVYQWRQVKLVQPVTS
jgi:hypothetical protein